MAMSLALYPFWEFIAALRLLSGVFWMLMLSTLNVRKTRSNSLAISSS